MIPIEDKKYAPIYIGQEFDPDKPTIRSFGLYAIISLEPSTKKSRTIGFNREEIDDNIGNKQHQAMPIGFRAYQEEVPEMIGNYQQKNIGFIETKKNIPDDLGNRIKTTVGFKPRR